MSFGGRKSRQPSGASLLVRHSKSSRPRRARAPARRCAWHRAAPPRIRDTAPCRQAGQQSPARVLPCRRRSLPSRFVFQFLVKRGFVPELRIAHVEKTRRGGTAVFVITGGDNAQAMPNQL